ncbi:hypothetical protein RJ640_013800 [Escallonia rubra]|uniref:Enoyl reductase (ER) domain-containing protein n=1 Tax=Escallonia rubra TaxID=112253 RepID=A0AA88QC87_9ASTE|nr:hypothetical protein RJ640_013800 [Escallonia rubra]
MLLHGNISIPLRSPLRLRAPYPRNVTVSAHPPIKSEYTVSDESLQSRGFTLLRTIEDLNHLNIVFVAVGFPRRDTDKIRLALENTDTLLWYEYEKTKRPVAFARATGDERLIADLKIHYFIFMIVATVGVAIRDVELKPLRNILWTGAFIVLVLFVFRPIIVKIWKRIPKGQPMKESQFFAILLVVLVSGFCAQTLGQSSGLAAAEGAALCIAGLTAHQALTQSAGLKLDGSDLRKNILITAVSGGVGHYAVQLAKLGNAHVTAICGARNVDLVKSLGADEVLDYKTPEGAALKSPSGQKYDAVIHCASSTPWSTFEPNLSANGKVIDITPGLGTLATYALKKLTFSKKQMVPLLLIPKGENLDFLVKLTKEGKLKTVIDSKYPLSKAEDAWAKSIDGHATGKIIIEP